MLTWYSVLEGTFEGKLRLMGMDIRGYFRPGMVILLVYEGKVWRFILQIGPDSSTGG